MVERREEDGGVGEGGGLARGGRVLAAAEGQGAGQDDRREREEDQGQAEGAREVGLEARGFGVAVAEEGCDEARPDDERDGLDGQPGEVGECVG